MRRLLLACVLCLIAHAAYGLTTDILAGDIPSGLPVSVNLGCSWDRNANEIVFIAYYSTPTGSISESVEPYVYANGDSVVFILSVEQASYSGYPLHHIVIEYGEVFDRC